MDVYPSEEDFGGLCIKEHFSILWGKEEEEEKEEAEQKSTGTMVSDEREDKVERKLHSEAAWSNVSTLIADSSSRFC